MNHLKYEELTTLLRNLGSDVADEDRIIYKTHNGVVAAFMGPGLASSTTRLEKCLTESMATVGKSEVWEYHADLAEFFELHLGGSII